jgi:hypothetical protein
LHNQGELPRKGKNPNSLALFVNANPNTLASAPLHQNQNHHDVILRKTYLLLKVFTLAGLFVRRLGAVA